MEITKEMIEKELGYEINEFKLEPLNKDGECIGLSVNVVPKRKLEFINTKITIGKSSDFNIDDIKTIMEKYKKKSANVSGEELKKIDYFAKKDDYIEISYWHNGEGFDVDICYTLSQRFQLTWGQFDAIKKLIKFLDKE
jgi:hypothetical protein